MSAHVINGISLTKEDIEAARERIDAELFHLNAEIRSRVAERERLEEERMLNMRVMNEWLAAELAKVESGG